MQTEARDTPIYAVIAAVQLPNVPDFEFDASLTELRELAKTLGLQVIHSFVQKRSTFDTAAYLGAGKRQEVRDYVAGDDGREIEFVLVDHELSPSQARNLEVEVGCEVMDRTMVILEIFHRNARSRAARAQVEIARLGYMAPRLREMAKLAGPQGRQRSGVGGRGAGESHTELDRRKIRDRIAELQLEITAMELERKTQRARRQGRQGLAAVALVGYTNAGKSTLMRALTGSEVLVANKLFATLDTTVRVLYPESVPRVLVSDTVGFIKNLPHGLVASFKSTLDEALEAELLLHVIDASDPGFERQLESFHDCNKELYKNRRLVVTAYVCTAVQLTAIFIIPYCVYRSFNLSGAPVSDMICSQAFVTMATCFIPLPGAAGAVRAGGGGRRGGAGPGGGQRCGGVPQAPL